MSKNLFITGTGTDVGKTYVTGLILKHFRKSNKQAAYFKAAMSGNARLLDGSLVPGDAKQVKTMSGIDEPLEAMCPYIYEKAVSPHLASKLEGNAIEMKTILQAFDKISKKADFLTVEGSGGIICPLRFDEKKIMLEDFIQARHLPCVIVADSGLGTINAVVLTVEYMRAHHITIKGLIFNRYQKANKLHGDNLAMCEKLTDVKVLTCVSENDTDLNLSIEALEKLYE